MYEITLSKKVQVVLEFKYQTNECEIVQYIANESGGITEYLLSAIYFLHENHAKNYLNDLIRKYGSFYKRFKPVKYTITVLAKPVK